MIMFHGIDVNVINLLDKVLRVSDGLLPITSSLKSNFTLFLPGFIPYTRVTVCI